MGPKTCNPTDLCVWKFNKWFRGMPHLFISKASINTSPAFKQSTCCQSTGNFQENSTIGSHKHREDDSNSPLSRYNFICSVDGEQQYQLTGVIRGLRWEHRDGAKKGMVAEMYRVLPSSRYLTCTVLLRACSHEKHTDNSFYFMCEKPGPKQQMGEWNVTPKPKVQRQSRPVHQSRLSVCY